MKVVTHIQKLIKTKYRQLELGAIRKLTNTKNTTLKNNSFLRIIP